MPSPWKFFSMEELRCRCGCGRADMNADFMEKVVKLRLHYGFPMIISSAFRCPDHNNKVSSTGKTGPHTTGHAMDIKVYGERALLLFRKAQELNLFTGFGVSQKGDISGRFIHLDDLIPAEAGSPRPWLWTY